MEDAPPFKRKRGRPKGSVHAVGSITKRDDHSAPGPFSGARKLAALDGRSLAGRVLNQTRADLINHCGGNPTAPERLLIESASVKATRLFLMSSKTIGDGLIDLDNDHHMTLAWLNSMRADLMALGLQRRIKDVTPSLSDFIKQHAEERAKTAKPTKSPPEFDE